MVAAGVLALGGRCLVRPSRRSLSGFVCSCFFPSSALAFGFGRGAAAALPLACCGAVVRPAAGGFAVSVPVAVPGGA